MSALRRRLLMYSAPVALLVVVAVVKLLSVVLTGHSVASSFTGHDTDAMASQVARLETLDVVEPGKADFAAGALAVLQDRLQDADRRFSVAVDRLDADESCSARVNLELVRETLGDRATADSDSAAAVAHYLAARDVVARAQPGCFVGNTDPDPDRRTVRNDAPARLDSKIDAARAVAAPVAPPPPVPEQAAQPASPGTSPTEPKDRLDPAAGDPLDRLQQILRDAASG